MTLLIGEKTVTHNLEFPSLENLAHVLRHPELWPKDFKWNNMHPHQNAIGLAFKFWSGPACYDDSTDEYKNVLAQRYAISVDDVERLLCTHLPAGRALFRNSADDIADRIDAYLRKAA